MMERPATQPSTALYDECLAMAQRAKQASFELAQLPSQQKNEWLWQAARRLEADRSRVFAANARDIEAAPAFGLTAAQIDRLRLDDSRLSAMAQALCELAELPDPVGETIETTVRPNGLQVTRVRAPLGVVFFIYESRPNVTADAAAICVKSGNAVILRGGKEAAHSSRALVEILQAAAADCGLPEHAVQIVGTSDRAAVGHFLSMPDLIDVAIPRGGEGLIRRVAAEAQMPVIKHFTGNCHVYVDRAADLQQALAITVNAKCQRMGVCNACESLLIHAEVAREFVPAVSEALGQRGIELRGDAATRALAPSAAAATEEDYSTEYLGPILSIKIVQDLDEAIAHINRYGSHHTDAIITQDSAAAGRFTARVDSAAVIVNASTRFHDGGELGLGAEIGISTDKFHARGPCGLRELTTYKYVVIGQGQIRE